LRITSWRREIACRARSIYSNSCSVTAWPARPEAAEQAAEQQAMARKLAKAHRTRPFRFINHGHSAAPTSPLKRCLVGLWEKFKRNAPKATEQHAMATQSAHHHSAAPTPPLKQSLVGLLKQFKWNARKEDKKGMLSSTSPQSRFPFS
jgi:hypothetical protein